MKHKTSITIGRPTYGDGRRAISIRVRDELSRITFLEMEMSLEDFACALTGAAEVGAMANYTGLKNLGKKKETQELLFPLPENHNYRNRKEVAVETAKLYTPEGWEASTYYNSQDSFPRIEDKYFAKTTMYRWVEVEEGEEDA